MNIKSYKVIFIAVVSLFLFGISGCSGFLKDMALESVDDYVNDMVNDFVANPYSIDEYSDSDVEFTDLTEEQREIASEFVALYKDNIEIRKLHINDSRERASLELTISDVKIFDDSTYFIGNKAELIDIIDNLNSHSVNVILTLTRHGTEWRFDDLSSLEDMFIEPMQLLCVLDSNGDPINITPQYISYTYSQNIVGGFWYDPLTGNPLNGNHMDVTPYLQYVFYFCEPTTLDITVELRRDGTAIDVSEINVDDEIIIDCSYGTDFENIGFGAGQYTVALVVDGIDVIESEVLEVG